MVNLGNIELSHKRYNRYNRIMLLKIALLSALTHHSLCPQNTHKHVSNLQLRTNKPSSISVDTYIKENTLTPFVLYTVLRACCRSILLYHSIQNSYHGNTTLTNFYIDKNLQCTLVQYEKYPLTKQGKYDDYIMFFDDYYHSMMYKNKHFENMFRMFNESFITNI